MRTFRIDAIDAAALSVALHEPFVIATGRVDATRSIVVTARISGGAGARAATSSDATGIGEGAALPGVTREDQDDALGAVRARGGEIVGRSFGSVAAVTEALDHAFGGAPVARAAVETAIVDAAARLEGRPLSAWLAANVGPGEDDGAPPPPVTSFVTDITLPIADAAHMAALAVGWRARGFAVFKVKVGKDVDRDLRALEAIVRAVPDARLRVDANAGFAADDAIAVARGLERLGVVLECFEQPCAAGDLDGMARVAAASAAPVVADESVATLADVARVVRARAARGVNLKIVKSGGPIAARAIGAAAARAGLVRMIGAMVETRLGLAAAAHVAASLGGVDFVDLDTAWLLAADPFHGGYVADGPKMTLTDAPGHGVART